MSENQIIEYVRRNGRKTKRDENGKVLVKGNGAGRSKKGVLWCGLIDEDKVGIGFSLCNSVDEFDYINGNKESGFGLELAISRAEKWSTYLGYFFQNSWSMEEIEEGYLEAYKNPDPKIIIEIPPSLEKPLKAFVKRCRNYFKDKEFPKWVEKFEKDEIESCELIEVFNISDDDLFIAD